MKQNGIQGFIVALPIFCIIVVATLFHFQIHFEDVLTLLPAQEYGIEISPWRMVFEPFFGLPLYFNRALYVLEELPFTFLWALIFYLAYRIIKIWKANTRKKSLILGSMANVLLLVCICFSFFIAILFLPLPNNTVANNDNNSVLVTTHAHTEYSHDGLISQEAMWAWHRKNGFDAFFITDHAGHDKSLEFVRKQRKGDFPLAPLVMVGQEYSASNHMSLLGLKSNFETKGMSDTEVVKAVHKQGGAVIINHWFDGKGEEKELYSRLGADGFEIENTGTDLYYDRSIFEEIKNFCEERGHIMVGGLDFHGYGRVCSLYNAFEIPDWRGMDPGTQESEILKILRNGPQDKIRILMYKDRSYYPKDHLFLRPFVTVFNYFRTLNKWQVLSWAIWLILFQGIGNRKKLRAKLRHFNLPVVAAIGALLPIILAVKYHYRGKSVLGYNDIYEEYSSLLGPIGGVFFCYAVTVWLFRKFYMQRQTSKD